MKTTDKFLIGIAIGVILLVGVAIVIALTRPKATYWPEDTPEGVVHNYLLALQEEDYERAYTYLSPTIPGYPISIEAFEENIQHYSYNFSLDNASVTLEVQPAHVTGSRATVPVRQTTFYEGGLFDSGQGTYLFETNLRRNNGVWQLIESDSYWANCWNYSDGCE